SAVVIVDLRIACPAVAMAEAGSAACNSDCRSYHSSATGWVTERSIVHAWKACVPKGTGGSNPPPSASFTFRDFGVPRLELPVVTSRRCLRATHRGNSRLGKRDNRVR